MSPAADLAAKTGAKLTMPQFTLFEGARYVKSDHGDIRNRFARMQTDAPAGAEQWLGLQKRDAK